MKLVIAALLGSSLTCFPPTENTPSSIEIETIIQSTSSWDGTPYKAYPAGQPQITILKITIAPHTTMKWHSHPLPNAGYILSGKLPFKKKTEPKSISWPDRPSLRLSIVSIVASPGRSLLCSSSSTPEP